MSCFICAVMLPYRVGEPKMTPSASRHPSDGGYWNVGLLLTNLHEVFVVCGLLDNLVKLSNAAEHDIHSRDGLRALCDGTRQLKNVSIVWCNKRLRIFIVGYFGFQFRFSLLRKRVIRATIIRRHLAIVPWPSQGEALKRLHGDDCAELFDILEAQ